MARLNDPPPPVAESIDALKRRFVRQNREIARANSTQSVRIRNLECEVSRLLGENSSLREQVIKLHYESGKIASNSILETVDTVKSKLEAKLSELGGLVKDLGEVKRTAEFQQTQKRKSINSSSPKRSPDQRIWKNALTLSEAVGGTDGRLPPIMEDKYYPRRTMSAEELLGLTTDPANLTDSPDLGPPPIAHFEEGDPIKFDHGPEESSHRMSAAAVEEGNPVLSANLETRKRRRESSQRRDMERQKPGTDSMKPVPAMESDPGQSLKSGAKRKLNVREEDDLSEAKDVLEKCDFPYSWKSSDVRRLENGISKPIMSKPGKVGNSKTSQAISSSTHHRTEKSVDAPAASVTNTRKALGPKSVNTDPTNSPLKISKSNTKDKIIDAKDDLSRVIRERNRMKNRPQPKSQDQPNHAEALAKITAAKSIDKPVEAPPETPAPPSTDVLSPNPTESSVPRPDSRDTPPPPDLGPDTGTGSFGRASRRPRGSVNYAQPNLRDKMRRPTAELVDAVAAEERARQARTAIAEREKSDSVIIKQEDADTDGLPVWKTNDPNDGKKREEPTSPLINKTVGSSNDLPSSVITERRRRTIAPSRNDEGEQPTNQSSAAASTIAALTVGSNKLKADKPRTDVTKDQFTHKSAERSSIYDFTGSSPNNGEIVDDPEGKEAGARTSRSRRHSSVPASSEHLKGSLSITRRAERRRESFVDARQDQSVTGAAPPIGRTRSVLELGGDGEETATGRSERAASRRRSMML